MIKTIIFDWDGTLHNTKHLYGCAFRKAYQWLVKEGYADPYHYTDDEVAVYLGMNVPDMWQAFMPRLPEPVWRRASDIIGEEMIAAIGDKKAVLYEGAEALLSSLKESGYALVFLSNCRHAYMEAHRAFFQLDRWFDGFYCCEDYDNAPKEAIFAKIAEVFPREYVMIGDRASDQKVATEHGFPFIGCNYGFGTEGELANADVLVDDVRYIEEKIADFL